LPGRPVFFYTALNSGTSSPTSRCPSSARSSGIRGAQPPPPSQRKPRNTPGNHAATTKQETCHDHRRHTI
jgi:hypothetical protein